MRGAILGPDAAIVQPYDGATDHKTEADAAVGTFGSAALELLEQYFRIAARQARTIVLDADFDLSRQRPGADSDLAARRCVLAGVIEQILQHLLDQAAVHVQ
jgi:hypothetical protein